MISRPIKLISVMTAVREMEAKMLKKDKGRSEQAVTTASSPRDPCR
jgi:hypothetical protein